MKTIRSLCEKLSCIGFARHGNGKQERILIVHDPDLVAMVRIADQRRDRENDDMERILGRVRHILDRKSQAPVPTQKVELPPQLKARVAAIPDAEERIRAIVNYTLSSKSKADTHD